MTPPAERADAAVDLAALGAITEAVAAGAGLPEVTRAAARALDASLALIDRSSAVLAVAAKSSNDERALLEVADAVDRLPLRVADEVVGELRLLSRTPLADTLLTLVTTLVGSEVERVRAPVRASREAAEEFVRAVLTRDGGEPDDLVARGKELAIDVEQGGCVLVVRARPQVPAQEGWRERVLALVERGARAAVPASVVLAAPREGVHAEVVVLVPGVGEEEAKRVGDGALRELAASLTGFSFAAGRSRAAAEVAELPRAHDEALLAANVAEGGEERRPLAFDETGAYRLLLSAMSEDPAELQRFFAETVEPLVAYDEQYETELVKTVEAYLDADGNVAGTAQRLYTHRHTVRYRLERVRDLSGLDVGSSDGREKLSLGLKAMRVLGITRPAGPATEQGSAAGRVARPARRP